MTSSDVIDVIIVGGGIIGAATAFELAENELRVLLLDRQQPGQEASWAAAGMLSPGPEYGDAQGLVPLSKVSFDLFPGFVRRVEERSGQNCGFQKKPALHLFFDAEADRHCEAVLAQHHGCGLPAEKISLAQARSMEPGVSAQARAVGQFPHEGYVDNRALTGAVLAAASYAGVEIRAGVEVTALCVENGRCTGVVAGGERIAARRGGHVVLAAGCYTGRLEQAARYAPTRPIRGQMVALRSSSVALGHVLRGARGYLAPRDDGRIVAGSTLEDAGFEKRLTPAGLQKILAAAVELVPALQDAAIIETWCGLRPDSPDHLPVLGPTDVEGMLIATGHFRNGILLAPVTAKLIRELIVDGRAGMDIATYSPMRFANRPARKPEAAGASQ